MINNLNLSNLQKEFKESPFQEFAIKIYNLSIYVEQIQSHLKNLGMDISHLIPHIITKLNSFLEDLRNSKDISQKLAHYFIKSFLITIDLEAYTIFSNQFPPINQQNLRSLNTKLAECRSVEGMQELLQELGIEELNIIAFQTHADERYGLEVAEIKCLSDIPNMWNRKVGVIIQRGWKKDNAVLEKAIVIKLLRE